MNERFFRPNIVISKCIEFDFCRYNAQIIRSEFVKKLQPHVHFISICPEVEINLGIPRSPVRVVLLNGRKELIQPETGKNVTQKIHDFSNKFLGNSNDIDGFILKSKSPSCGLKDVKIYNTIEKSAAINRDSGLFGEAVLSNFPYLAIEDEARLRNASIREHFLKKIYTFARFRTVYESQDINQLIKFQSENKFLLMSYSQKYLKQLGKIVANKEKKSISKLLNEYKDTLSCIYIKGPRCTSNINVLQHAFGYVSKFLQTEEKNFFLTNLTNFKVGRVPLSVPVNLMKSWIIRYNVTYLKNQTFFEPYPIDLLDAQARNLCSSKEYWK
jgi:uncharacterized protein YbgA (DUF1722 family)/uncharacterized protein YbbK (DUF523 family)